MKDSHIFSRNRCTSVEQIDENRIRSCCRLQDTNMDALTEVTVKLPDLEIIGVRTEVIRSLAKECHEDMGPLQGIVGVRIGPGLRKIIKGLVDGRIGCGQIVFMIEECCQAVILSFTKEQLKKRPDNIKEATAYYHGMVENNIQLYNRCAAFAKGSSLVAGLEPD
jgi:hypothetical protein